jgi:hypothetical protein
MKIKPHHIIFIFFVLLHALLININVAEWGDSYRILRASEFIRNIHIYPDDEKRPPLYSVLLSVRPSSADPVLWGRVEMFILSILGFIIFKKLTDLYIKEEKYRNLALILFTLNPVFLYWSLRVYADVPFALQVLLTFYLFRKWQSHFDMQKSLFIGIIAGCAVLTRFEGYLLVAALGLGFLITKNIKPIISYGVGVSAVLVPYLIWRNPFTSSYFEEPAGRTYDVKMFITYIISLLFAFGFVSAFFFIANNRKILRSWAVGNIHITAFVIAELLLILSWPAALPRLFVPVIPVLIILMSQLISAFFESKEKRSLSPLLGLTTLLIIYIVGQYFLKLQFLVLFKYIFVLIVLVQIINIYSIYIKNFKIFVITLITSLLIWSLSTVWLHKDNFKAIVNASEYASTHLTGTIAYNDVSGVSGWYLNERSRDAKGVYYFYDKKKDLDYTKLVSKKFDYIILTNEHNTDMTLDLSTRPYLKELKEFRYNIGGKVFFAKILLIQNMVQ